MLQSEFLDSKMALWLAVNKNFCKKKIKNKVIKEINKLIINKLQFKFIKIS